MAKKRSFVLQKVTNLMKISIFIAKMGKPIIPNLIFLQKTRKLKKFNHLKHYNYGFIQEYQFSPSNTPLIHYYRKPLHKKRRWCRDILSMLFLCGCLGSLRVDGREGECPLEALPAIKDFALIVESSDSSDEDDSVDQKAERFIERFYEEMRMQRQESVILKLKDVLEVGCC